MPVAQESCAEIPLTLVLTIKWCNSSRTEVTSIMNHRESLKSVTEKMFCVEVIE